MLVAQSCLTLCNPMHSSPPGSSLRGILQLGRNTGVDSHSLRQGFFPTQGSNPGLLHCKQILYCLSHQGSTGVFNAPIFNIITKKDRFTSAILLFYVISLLSPISFITTLSCVKCTIFIPFSFPRAYIRTYIFV